MKDNSTHLYSNIGLFLATGNFVFERKDLAAVAKQLQKFDIKFMYEGVGYADHTARELVETAVTTRRPVPPTTTPTDLINVILVKGKESITKYVRSGITKGLPVGTKAHIDFIINRPAFGYKIIEGTAIRRSYHLDKAEADIEAVCFISNGLTDDEKLLPEWDIDGTEYSQRVYAEHTLVTEVAIVVLASMNVETGHIDKIVIG